MNAIAADIRLIEDEIAAQACFPLMRQLRPHLTSCDEFLALWRRQMAGGYRLVALWRGGRPAALAGFRLQENLVHGRHVHIDDLVTDEAERSSGCGHAMMQWLKEETRRLGCRKLTLDTPMNNSRGHRFYFREGLLATALRFSEELGPAADPR
jgi:GNAT superfamily N-acetyltransferase